MDLLTIKELVRNIKLPVEELQVRYAIIYPLIDKCIICSKSDMLSELAKLWDIDVENLHIIRIHKDMEMESALLIATVSGFEHEFLKSIYMDDMTPYEGLREWDLI